MKSVTRFGLGVIAAMAAMAFLGATSAPANVLCRENASPCPPGQDYTIGSKFAGIALVPIFTGSIEVVCDRSEVLVEVTNTGGAGNVTGKVTALDFTDCESGGIKCTVTVNKIPYHLEIEGTGSTASVRVASGGAGQPNFKVVCGFFLNCTFTSPTFELGMDEGAANTASVTANEEELEKIADGGICPEEAFWDAKYVLTSAAWVI